MEGACKNVQVPLEVCEKKNQNILREREHYTHYTYVTCIVFVLQTYNLAEPYVGF